MVFVEQDRTHQELIAGLKRFATLGDLYRSDFYRRNKARLAALLETTALYPASDVPPRERRFIRAVAWNIEKGKNFEGILNSLQTHPLLREADLILLNEVDWGMNRSGNRHIARDLGQALGLHAAFAPAFLELTKGINDERDRPGENTVSLQGNAILSRFPFRRLRVISLPQLFEPFEAEEKRWGRRSALVAEVTLADATALTVVCTHLETRTTPAGRLLQMRTILDRLDEWEVSGPLLIGGDLNTSTFARGTRWRALQGVFRIIVEPRRRLERALLRPDRANESLFHLLEQRGYRYRDLNDEQATYIQPVEVVEDAYYVPRFSQKLVIEKFAATGGRVGLRLDWFIGRGLRPLAENEIVDPLTGVASARPQTINGLIHSAGPLSDHHPIVVDFIPLYPGISLRAG